MALQPLNVYRTICSVCQNLICTCMSLLHLCLLFDFGGKKRLGSGGANKKKQQTVRVNAGA